MKETGHFFSMAGLASYKLENYKKAAYFFQKSYDKFNNLFCVKILADAYRLDGQYQKGVGILKKSLPQLKGKHFAAMKIENLNALAWRLSVCKEVLDAPAALKYALMCNKMSGKKVPDYLDTLACAYAANENFKEANKWIDKAIAFEKDETVKDGFKKKKKLFQGNKAYVEE